MADGLLWILRYYLDNDCFLMEVKEYSMAKTQLSNQLGFKPKQNLESNKRLRRFLLKIISIILIIFGWSFPLLMIIKLFPDSLFLMFAGVILTGIGTIIILLIESGEI